MSTSQTVLVTGASGQLGRLVIQHLLQTEKIPAKQIIATTRNVASLSDLSAQGIQVRQADFDDIAALTHAFSGAQRLLLISTDALDIPGHRLNQHKNAITAAIQAGVAHVVYTSMPKAENSAVTFAPDHYGTEQALAVSPLAWTVLRNSWYFENILANAPQWLASGQAYTAAGEGKISHIARDDLARAAAKALVSDEVGNRILTLTGSEALSTEEIVNLVAQVMGKPIATVHVTLDAVIKGMVQAGLPQPIAEVYASFDTNTRNGGVAEITDDFIQLTGRTPQKFVDWLNDHKAVLMG